MLYMTPFWTLTRFAKTWCIGIAYKACLRKKAFKFLPKQFTFTAKRARPYMCELYGRECMGHDCIGRSCVACEHTGHDVVETY